MPSCTFSVMGDEGPGPVSTSDLCNGKKVLLFAVPGAFTPGCSMTHLPGYVANADTIKSKGVDSIVCMSVNDAFVMGAWGKAQNADDIMMLADGNGELTAALGLELDGSGFGLGTRSQRFAMIIEDGKVTHLNVEEGPGDRCQLCRDDDGPALIKVSERAPQPLWCALTPFCSAAGYVSRAQVTVAMTSAPIGSVRTPPAPSAESAARHYQTRPHWVPLPPAA